MNSVKILSIGVTCLALALGLHIAFGHHTDGHDKGKAVAVEPGDVQRDDDAPKQEVQKAQPAPIVVPPRPEAPNGAPDVVYAPANPMPQQPPDAVIHEVGAAVGALGTGVDEKGTGSGSPGTSGHKDAKEGKKDPKEVKKDPKGAKTDPKDAKKDP